MKIVDVRFTPLSIPFIKPLIWPFGRQDGITMILVELFTDNGLVGIGESSVIQRPAEASVAFLEAAKPYVLGEDPFNTERIAKKFRSLAGWHFARSFGNRLLSGIDTALWDVTGKACGQPLYKLLGGAFRKTIPVIKVILDDTPENMAQVAKDAVAAGYDTLYVKYTTIPALLERLDAIHEAVGSTIKLRIDFNQTLSVGYAVKLFNTELSRYNIEFIEQPVPAANLEGMSLLRRSVQIPIAADESCQNMYEALNVIRHEAADILHINPRMHDSLWDAKKTAGMAEAAGLSVVAQSLVEGGAAQALFLHLIASTPNFNSANQCMYDNLADDYISERWIIERGQMHVPEDPGLGLVLDEEKVRQYAEHFKTMGTYSVFTTPDELLPNIPIKSIPIY